MVKHALTTFPNKLLPEIVGADQVYIALFMERSRCLGRNVFGVSLEDFSDRETRVTVNQFLYILASRYISRY